MRIVLSLGFAVLALAPAAQAVSAPEVASAIAPGSYSCPAEPEWQTLLAREGFVGVHGIANRPGGWAAFAPWVCNAVSNQTAALGAALNVIAHEASHLRGVSDESEAACWGLLWAQDLARRFYGIEFHTPRSALVAREALAYHRASAAHYRVLCV